MSRKPELERATLTIDLDKIEENARRVVECARGVEIVGVTKVTCGDPDVARAMLRGGAVAIGESRLENVARLRDAGVRGPFWLLRAATPAVAKEAVRLVDVSLASEVSSVRALSDAAVSAGRRHGVVAMVDLGDLREGMMPDEVPDFVQQVEALPSVDLAGIGVSLTCYGGIVPDKSNLGELVELAKAATTRLGRRVSVSGGMSSSLDAIVAGEMPEGVDNLRVGESILLGVSTVTRRPLLDLHTDALVLEAPIIEVKTKPSAPRGVVAQDAFGNVPAFDDLGLRRRALCALGRQDAPPEGLRPVDAGVRVLGASSDHLILDVEEARSDLAVGDSVAFVPNYAATLLSFTSPYVHKRYVGERVD